MGMSLGEYELNHESANTSDLMTRTQLSNYILLPR